jgi:hypothetical protein
MKKSSLGKDLVKIYRIKGKASKMEEEPEMEMENETEDEQDPGSMLRQAADMIDEGNIEEAYGVIDEAVAMCKEMHGEEEYD